jgi:hypothetical protein
MDKVQKISFRVITPHRQKPSGNSKSGSSLKTLSLEKVVQNVLYKLDDTFSNTGIPTGRNVSAWRAKDRNRSANDWNCLPHVTVEAHSHQSSAAIVVPVTSLQLKV